MGSVERLGTGRPVTSTVESGHWVHANTNFIHKGEIQRFPLSTRLRSSPSRGTTRMSSPAGVQLRLSHDYRRIPNARVPRKHFFHDRAGKRRFVPGAGSRFSQARRRGGGAMRPAIRASRPR